MAQQKKMVESITSMEEDFSQWYTDVVKKAELMDYSSVKGCMVIEPYGYAIWENMQREMDPALRSWACRTCTCPCSFPRACCRRRRTTWRALPPSAPWSPRAAARSWRRSLFIRPTSETLFCEHYQKSDSLLPGPAQAVQPVVQRAAVGERPPGLSCGASEFLWQEGHTMHETAEEAEEFTLKMLQVYDEASTGMCWPSPR